MRRPIHARAISRHVLALGVCLGPSACSDSAPASDVRSLRSGSTAVHAAVVEPVTTVVLVRHAEKEDGDDPGLTPAGRERAARLTDALSEAGVDAIYASQFRRTQETAALVASSVGLEVEIVDARDIEGLSHRLRGEHAGETVLVVSHSNIIPEVIRALGGEAEEIPEDEYDDLFVVLVNGATGDASAVHLNYGAASGGE